MDLTLADWIGIAAIATPLIVKAATDLSAYLDSRKYNALARIVGMAGREAATIQVALSALPANANAAQAEKAMVAASAQSILTEMGQSSATAGANADKLANIVSGELNKVKAPAVATTVAIPLSAVPVR